MKKWMRILDRVLRGEYTAGQNLENGLSEIPIGALTGLIVFMGAIYGFGMGSYALFNQSPPSWAQFFASAIKAPLLFLLTLIITFPSLYVFNALVGSKLLLLPVLRLLLAGLAITMAVLASFGPIVLFFSFTTTSYPFMVLLNVAMCAVAGALGLTFLRQTLHRLTPSSPARPRFSSASAGASPAPALTEPPPIPGVLEPLDDRPLGASVRGVFRCWMLLFALVGSQMSWVLRPFIGDPHNPFTLLRPRGSNFFAAVWSHLVQLFQ